jgi:hypothetical protein
MKIQYPRKYSSAPIKAEEPKKEIPQPIVEETEEIIDNPDDGEGEG